MGIDIHKEPRIILKFEDDIDGTEKAWVSLDNSSGGYPCGVANPLQAHVWETEEKALRYARMFQLYPLKIQQRVFKIEVTVVLEHLGR